MLCESAILDSNFGYCYDCGEADNMFICTGCDCLTNDNDCAEHEFGMCIECEQQDPCDAAYEYATGACHMC